MRMRILCDEAESRARNTRHDRGHRQRRSATSCALRESPRYCRVRIGCSMKWYVSHARPSETSAIVPSRARYAFAEIVGAREREQRPVPQIPGVRELPDRHHAARRQPALHGSEPGPQPAAMSATVPSVGNSTAVPGYATVLSSITVATPISTMPMTNSTVRTNVGQRAIDRCSEHECAAERKLPRPHRHQEERTGRIAVRHAHVRQRTS